MARIEALEQQTPNTQRSMSSTDMAFVIEPQKDGYFFQQFKAVDAASTWPHLQGASSVSSHGVTPSASASLPVACYEREDILYGCC